MSSTTSTTRSQELANFFEEQDSAIEDLLTAIGYDALRSYREGNHEWLSEDLRAYKTQLEGLLRSARYFKEVYDLKARKERGEY